MRQSQERFAICGGVPRASGFRMTHKAAALILWPSSCVDRSVVHAAFPCFFSASGDTCSGGRVHVRDPLGQHRMFRRDRRGSHGYQLRHRPEERSSRLATACNMRRGLGSFLHYGGAGTRPNGMHQSPSRHKYSRKGALRRQRVLGRDHMHLRDDRSDLPQCRRARLFPVATVASSLLTSLLARSPETGGGDE